MLADEWERDWGGWVLGDLADTLKAVADLLGRSQDVARVTLSAPIAEDAGPNVAVAVDDPAGVCRLRHAVLNGEYLVDFTERPTEQGWTAEVAGLVLSVRLEEAS